MKKFLSIALAAMMLVSLFAVNVGAAPSAVYRPETVYDYQLNNFETATDFTVFNAHAQVNIETDPANAENKAMKLYTDYNKAGAYVPVTLPDAFTVEFDVYADLQGRALIFGIEKNDVLAQVGIKGYSMMNDTWYTYRISFDGTTVEKVERTLKGQDAWDEAESQSSYLNAVDGVTDEAGKYANIYRANTTYLNGAEDATNAIAFGTYNAGYNNAEISEDLFPEFFDADKNFVGLGDDSIYYIDNLKVYHTGEVFDYIADTVYLEQDYENESNTAGTTNTIGAVLTRETEGDNHYYSMKPAASGVILANVGSDLGFAAREDVEVIFDVMAEAPGSFGVEFTNGTTTADRGTVFFRTDEGMELGAWYTYRVRFAGNVNGEYCVARKKLEDDAQWETLVMAANGSSDPNVYECGYRTARTKLTQGIAFASMSEVANNPANAVLADQVWNVDNIKVISKEFIKVADVDATETTVSAKVDFSNAAFYNTAEQYTVMMASYEGGVLADVDFGVATAAAGAVANVNLSVEKTDDVRIYVWNADNTPVLTNVFDLDACFSLLD